MIRTTEIAPGLAVAAQLKAEDVAGLAEQGVKTIINNRPDGEEGGQPTAAIIRDEAKQHDIGYVHQPVTMNTIGAAEVAAFEKHLKDSPKPILAHCRSGTRTYTLWAAGQVLHNGADANALVADAAAKGFDLKALPAIVAKIKAG